MVFLTGFFHAFFFFVIKTNGLFFMWLSFFNGLTFAWFPIFLQKFAGEAAYRVKEKYEKINGLR